MRKSIIAIASLLLLLLLSAAPARAQYILGNLPLTMTGCTTAGLSINYNRATKTWECASKYGGMYFYTAAAGAPTAQVINIDQQYHGVYLTASGGSSAGWTTKAGTSGAINSVADNSGVVANTILITTAADHNLAVGDYVAQNGFTTRTTYRGKYRVLTTPLVTTYTVARPFEVSTDTGWFQRAWSMTASAGSAGLYLVTFSMSAEADANTTDLRWEVNLNATDLDNIASQNFYSTLARAQTTSATGIVSIADGDTLYMSVKNLTDGTDWKVWLANLVATRM
jgi:hypothetical protein